VAQRLEGTVVSFNDDRGFGFIRPDDGGEDYFVRFTAMVMDGYRSLPVGRRVRFEPFIEPGTGNRQALEVHLLP
jgi:cold shock protein